MKKIEIETTSDDHDCETCGPTWAEGGIVRVDGVEVLHREPLAHCYDGVNFSETDLLVMSLKKLGVEVMVDGKPFHVCRYDEEYHGKEEWS